MKTRSSSSATTRATTRKAIAAAPVHVEGITYQHRYTRCGKARCKKGCRDGAASHGPYWYSFHWNPKTGRTVVHYVGKELPRVDALLDRPEMNP